MGRCKASLESPQSAVDDVSQWVVSGLLGLLPVIFVTQLTSEFYLPKLAVLVIATAILGALAAVRYVASRKMKGGYSPLDVSVAVFALAILFSLIFSVSPANSFIGRYNYPEGALTFTGYLLLYLCVSRIDWNGRRLSVLLWGIASGAAIVCTYALVQIAGLDPVRWELTFSSNRVASTLGNPTQLAAYLVAAAPFVGWLAVYPGLARRFAAILLLAIMLFVLWKSEGRSGMVAAAVAVAVAAAVRYRLTKLAARPPSQTEGGRRSVLITAGAALFLIAMTAVLTIAASSALRPRGEEPVPSALESARERPPRESSLEDRKNIWISSLSMIAERPEQGWGPDLFELTFPRFQSLQSARLESADGQLGRRAEDAHDLFLEYAATLGLVGICGFVVLLLVAFDAALKRMPRLPGTPGDEAVSGVWPTVLIAAALAAFLVPALTTPVTMASAAFFWLVAGLLSSRLGGWRKRKRLTPVRKTVVLSATAVAGLALIAVASILLIADARISQAEEAWQARQPEQALPAYAQAARMNPLRDKYLGQYGLRVATYGTQTENRASVEAGLGLLSQARQANPAEATYPLIMARIVLDNSSSRADVDRARELLREAFRLAPNDARVSLYFAESSAMLQRAEASPVLAEEEEAALTRAIAIAPTLLPAWKSLGGLYLRSGRLDEAERAYVEAERIAPRDPAVIEALETIRSAPFGE